MATRPAGVGRAERYPAPEQVVAQHDSSTLPRRQLGRHLREWRTRAGLTIAEAARLMEWGATTLQRLEKGQADRIRTIDVRELCRVYGIPDEIAFGLEGLARQTADTHWWHAFGELIPEHFEVYRGVEASARHLSTYQPDLVPVLFRTAEYLRALAGGAEERVQRTLRGQSLITRKSLPATVDAVLHESVLRRLVGGPRVMAAQLRHLADLSTRANVRLRVLPFAAGAPVGGTVAPFTLLDFGADRRGRSIEPPVVYTEGLTGGLYLESERDVRRYDAAHECLRGSALDIPSSRNLLRRVAKEYAA
ncbi:helix-turn-helix domain-containing protein [Nocardia sp. NPDC057227]|uniref:helix-turn-helix domain-containing protein n=1 Tax=Nocardia sp. NPDC057227 TaxID=3346056 RepID=UPI0036269B26